MTRALIDTEYFLYRCAAGAEQEANWGDDNWTYICRHDDARAAFEEQIADILGQLIGYQPVLVFGDKHSFRYGVWPQYKANRKKMRKPAGYSALTEWVMTKFEDESTHIIRRRHCEFCGEKFYSAQPVERVAEIKWTTGLKGISIPKLIKVDGSRRRKRTA